MNFGGFENCLHRTNQEHRSEAQEILLEDTFQGREDKQTQYGTRDTELMQLEYFDCIRFTIIDPMHNLFLGTAKHMVKDVWLPNKTLKPADLKSIQNLIDNMKVPSNIGRIPNKIATSFGSFTSEQWKLWTVVYSEFALKKYLPAEDLINCGFCLLQRAEYLLLQLLLPVPWPMLTLHLCNFARNLNPCMDRCKLLLICICILTSSTVCWIMDLFTTFGCFHLNGLMESLEISKPTKEQ